MGRRASAVSKNVTPRIEGRTDQRLPPACPFCRAVVIQLRPSASGQGRRLRDRCFRVYASAHGSFSSSLILLVADASLHPVDNLAVVMFLDGDMGHGRSGRSTRANVSHPERTRQRPRPSLRSDRPRVAPAQTGCHDQGLTDRVGVPRRAAPGSNVTLATRPREWNCWLETAGPYGPFR